MYSFIISLFQSKESKLAEQYEEYKKKFPKHKLWRKGNEWIVNSFVVHPNPDIKENHEMKHIIRRGLYNEPVTEIEAKAYYVKQCKTVEQDQKPLREV